MADNEAEVSRFNPRHRIIGAIILVALAVIFIPMILDESTPPPDIKPGSEAATSATTPDTKVVVTPVANLGTGNATAAAVGPVPDAPKPEATAAPTPPPVELVAKPEAATTTAEPKTAAKPAAVKSADSAKPAKVKKGWVVQVGVYSHADNARRIEEKLHSHGYTVLSDSVTLDSGKAVRLRVGPYKDKAAAEKAEPQIGKLLGEQVLVRAYP